jgi:agmatine deiminase
MKYLLLVSLFLVTIYSETEPPIGPISAFSEFDISEGAFVSYGSIMSYSFGLPFNLLRDFSEDAKLFVLVPSNLQNNCHIQLENNNVNMENVVYLNFTHDTYWTKNFGPYFIVDGNQEIGIVDFQYDRPDRINDNAIPFQLANYWNYNYFDSDIVHNGGNLMFNGINQAASSTLPYNANQNIDVDQMMLDYYGVDTYHTVEDPWGNYHEHVDCWAKFLSHEKIIICQVPASHYKYAEMENVVSHYEEQLNSYGEPYEIHRVYTPNGEPYANSYIMNGKVYVPTGFGQYDDDAIESFQNALPGYEVEGYNFNNFISTDALNCRVMNIPDFEAIRIFHNSINDSPVPMNEYEVNATFTDLSGSGLNISTLKVYWKNQYMENYHSINLEYNNENYQAFIPSQPGDTPVHYFIEAGNSAGRIDRLPISGYFDFHALGGPGFELGDINMDYLININDIFEIIYHVLNTNPISGYGLILADLNEDNTVNVFDIIRIVNIILGN